MVHRRRSRAGESRSSSICSRCRPTGSATRPCRSRQLKILQEVITLLVFVPFAVAYMKEPIKLDYVWAALCIMGAVYFVFRSHGR